MNPATIREMGGSVFFEEATAVVINERFVGFAHTSEDTALGDVGLSSKFTSAMKMTESGKRTVTVRLLSREYIEDAAELHVTSRLL